MKMIKTLRNGILAFALGLTFSAGPALAYNSGDLPAGANVVGQLIATVANKLSVFAATTSAELRGVISDETGTGVLVFANAPTINNPTFTGSLTGNLIGNASTATALQNARTINGVSFDGSGNIVVASAAGTITGTTLASNVVSSSLTSVGTLGTLTVTAPIAGSVTGNAGTATVLATPRTINGVSFDGSGNILVASAAGTLTGTDLAANVVSSSLTGVGTIGTGVWQGTPVADAYIASASTWNAKQAALPAGTTTTLLHGNASGSPSYTAVTTSDMAAGTANSLLGYSGAGAASGVTVGSGLSLSGGTLTSTGTGGTVTTVSVASANGLAGSVANATTTPAITLSTTVTGITKGNGTALSAATSGTDYAPGTSGLATGILKSTTTTGALTIAAAGDFPTLNQNTSGNAATATALSTAGTATTVLHGNASGAPSYGAVALGTDVSGTLAAAQFPALTGDATTSAGSLATTLATVNSNVGSFGSSTAIPAFTVNGKGLVTAASTNTVVAPAGTITGTTLASNVVNSSITTVGNGIALQTPASGVATNLTGTAAGLTAGNVTTNANMTGDVTSVGNATTIANSAVTNAKIANSAIDLTAKVTGALPLANGGCASTSAVGCLNTLLTASGTGVNPQTFPRRYDVANTAASYLPQSIYGVNLDPVYLPHWRAAASRVKYGSGRGFVIRLGDSTTIGINGSGVATWPNQGSYLAGMLSSSGIPAFQNSFSGLSASGTGARQGNDPRIVMGSFANSGFQTLGGQLPGASGTTPFTFMPTTPIDTATVYYEAGEFGGNGTGTIKVGSGSTAAITNGSAVYPGVFGSATATSTLATQAVSITRTANTVYFSAIRAYDSTTPGIDIMDAGWWGALLSDVTAGGTYGFQPRNMIVSMAPDLVILKIGINDIVNLTSLATYKSQFNTFIAALQAANIDVILETDNPYNPGQSYAVQQTYINAMYEVAIANNVPMIDNFSILQTYANMNTLGWSSDGTHPNSLGYGEMASYEAALLLGVTPAGSPQASSASPWTAIINGIERARITTAGLLGIGTPTPAYAIDAVGGIAGSGMISKGTKFTVAGSGGGCGTIGTTTGGGSAGTFVAGAVTSCQVTITINGATGLSAPNGWACSAADLTTPSDTSTWSAKSGGSATTCILAGTIVSGDTVQFTTTGY